jgi:hypothetical protein
VARDSRGTDEPVAEIVPNTQPHLVVREGLRLLKEQDEVRLRWREQIERGWQEAQAGRLSTVTTRFEASMRASRRPPPASEADGGVPADSICRGAHPRHRRVHCH